MTGFQIFVRKEILKGRKSEGIGDNHSKVRGGQGRNNEKPENRQCLEPDRCC